MSTEELDRKIAELVMGEPEPTLEKAEEVYWENPLVRDEASENWQVVFTDKPEWQPLPFSTNLDQAMRAVDRYFDAVENHDQEMFMEYRRSARAPYAASLNNKVGLGSTLPEAICRLLLALEEEK